MKDTKFFFAPEFKLREGKGRGQYMRWCNMYETDWRREAIIAALYIAHNTTRTHATTAQVV